VWKVTSSQTRLGCLAGANHLAPLPGAVGEERSRKLCRRDIGIGTPPTCPDDLRLQRPDWQRNADGLVSRSTISRRSGRRRALRPEKGGGLVSRHGNRRWREDSGQQIETGPGVGRRRAAAQGGKPGYVRDGTAGCRTSMNLAAQQSGREGPAGRQRDREGCMSTAGLHS